MNDWQDRMGVGSLQPIDRFVTDMSRTRTTVLEGEHKPVAAHLTEHRSGRQDAVVYAEPFRVSREQIEAIKHRLGFSDRQMTEALNNIFGVKGTIQYARR